tara:strand:- start:1819 stop:2442 length:624 start_codon:yes stop_codon:yes gene_type:complete
MGKGKLTLVLFLSVIFLLIFSMYRITQPRVLSTEEMKINGFVKYGKYTELRDFDLIDHNNLKFNKDNFEESKLNFIYFGYTTCPTECPVMMSVMRSIYSKIDTESISFYLVSFDPEIDTTQRLKNYVTAFDEKFIGVTGETPEILKLGYQMGVERLEPSVDHQNHRVITHTNHLIAINSDAEVVGVFKGPFDSSAMSLVIKSLLRTE